LNETVKKPIPSVIIETAEQWSGRATLLILFGIVLEIGILFIFTHEISLIEKIGLTLANLLIAIGLAIEYVCIRKAAFAAVELQRSADEKIAASGLQSAEANQKALEAQVELARLKAPRTLSPKQQERITSKIEQFSGQEYAIGVSTSSDAVSFSDLIDTLLKAAGWKKVAPLGAVTVHGAAFALTAIAGIRVQVAPSQKAEYEPIADVLASALAFEGIEASAATSLDVEKRPTAIQIIIGNKI
jgi:hypothetical protein